MSNDRVPESARRFTITGSAYRGATGISRAIVYTASECTGCFDRAAMHARLAELEPGDSAEWPALVFVCGPQDPPPIVITRER